ncbi:predicted protein [Histoplasma mississippiense (nom. inval.)]|uniref:predicted protein n=1 Tax=Ajellomyces capsulatus (strain NAm1 / WU24) TaxID=2059318 RepID=UPI000157CD10|nr:predicted protein [Histoplasma mississippiense (nom. inval.)]EDN10124.1 predicted protein [Histoplasma mississippiense (nom. inval.)]
MFSLASLIFFRAGPIRPLLPSKEFRLNLKKMDDFMQPFIDEVCDRLVAILLAGRDAAATLCFRLFELSHNPTVDAPLRTEVLDRLGTSRKPSYSDFKEMEYLTAVLNETLRLCHAAVDPTATHSDKKRTIPYFDPLLWIPERWTAGWQPRPWHFIPLSGGPRICLGQPFAMLEMSRILQNFSEIIADGACRDRGSRPAFQV